MINKICPKCKQEKAVSEFSVKTKIQGGKKYTASECHSCSSERVKVWYRMKINSERLRERIYDLLGNKCQRCGFSDKRALQIDHINNDGYTERKIYRGQNMYRHILAVNGNGYQILCANCNWIKRFEILAK